MQGSPEVLATLQFAVGAEAHLNMQYRLDWRSVKFLGAKKTAKKIHGLGDDTHDWQKKFTDRVLFLEGTPKFSVPEITEIEQADGPLTATLQRELAMEMATIKPYEESVQIAMRALDDTTRNLFEHALKLHEHHVAWLEQQLALIVILGENDYLQEKL